jgi:hypothetical protein
MSAGAPPGLYFSARSVISLSIGIISIAFSAGRYKNLDLFVGAVCFVTDFEFYKVMPTNVFDEKDNVTLFLMIWYCNANTLNCFTRH